MVLRKPSAKDVALEMELEDIARLRERLGAAADASWRGLAESLQVTPSPLRRCWLSRPSVLATTTLALCSSVLKVRPLRKDCQAKVSELPPACPVCPPVCAGAKTAGWELNSDALHCCVTKRWQTEEGPKPSTNPDSIRAEPGQFNRTSTIPAYVIWDPDTFRTVPGWERQVTWQILERAIFCFRRLTNRCSVGSS